MKKFIITILLLIAIVIVGRYYYNKNKDKKQASNVPSTQESKPQAEAPKPEPVNTNPSVKTYTMTEVAKHGSDMNNYVDCWTVIHDKVYDIIAYADSLKHPGGEQIYQACGRDATELFENRPGKGTPHPESARQILEKYYIGDLKK